MWLPGGTWSVGSVWAGQDNPGRRRGPEGEARRPAASPWHRIARQSPSVDVLEGEEVEGVSRLAGRVAIVTGAGQGIGRGIARRFASEGARVIVAEIDEASGRATAEAIGTELAGEARFVRTDVGKKEDVLEAVEQAVAHFGSADVLVNNAWGGGTVERLEHKSDAAMEHGIRVGLMGAFWAMQAAFPHMRKAGWGRIVNLCSLNGVNAHMYTAEYNVAKEALRALAILSACTRTSGNSSIKPWLYPLEIRPASILVKTDSFA